MIRFDSVTKRYPDGIRWFRSIATTSAPDDSGGSGRGFGTERDPTRLVLFSDAVFAIAVTLLVLEIHPPQDTRHLLHGMAVIAAFIPFYWRPIPGEIASAKPRHHGRGHA